MLLLVFLLACNDELPSVALETCQLLPGLATDQRGLELLESKILEKEYEILQKADPTMGLALVGSDGLERLRSQVKCSVENSSKIGKNKWSVRLARQQPRLNPDGSMGEMETVHLDWRIEGPPPFRTRIGLDSAEQLRGQAAEASQNGQYKWAAALWKAIYRKFPDPLLAVDLAAAQEASERFQYRRELEPQVQSVTGSKVLGQVHNNGDRAISSATISVEYTEVGKISEEQESTDSSDGNTTGTSTQERKSVWKAPEPIERSLFVEIASLEPGETADFELELPDLEQGSIRMKTVEVHF